MPGAFKLDHLQPFKPILSWTIFNFFTFILGSQFLLPQRLIMGKGKISQLPIWMTQRDFSAWGQIQRIQLVYSYSLCHLKCSHFEQEKHSDWSNGIGWSKQTIWLVQLLAMFRGFEKYFRFRGTIFPFLKRPLQAVSFVSGYNQFFDDSTQKIWQNCKSLCDCGFQCRTQWCYFSLPSFPLFLRSVSFS